MFLTAGIVVQRDFNMSPPDFVAEKARYTYIYQMFLLNLKDCSQDKCMMMQSISENILGTSTLISPSQVLELHLTVELALQKGRVFIHFEFKEGCTIEWTTWCQVPMVQGICSYTFMIQKIIYWHIEQNGPLTWISTSSEISYGYYRIIHMFRLSIELVLFPTWMTTVFS